MAKQLLVLIGTRKGAFILAGDPDGRGSAESWRLSGPLCEGWPINHFRHDPATGALLAGGGSPWYGAAVWRSDDLGASWTHSSQGITYGDDGPAMRSVWHVEPVGDVLYAGVEPAGLFKSLDGGASWTHVEGLRNHPSRPGWQPGNVGLICHTVFAHPSDADRMWVAISAVGCFATEDGGETWEARNHGVRVDGLPDPYPETGQCVHKMVAAAGRPDRLYQQNHCGIYRLNRPATRWTRVGRNMPTDVGDIGFGVVPHPRDPDTAWVFPMDGTGDWSRTSPGGKPAVYRTSDAGASWERQDAGLPTEQAWWTVKRQAMAADARDPVGLYLGNTSGELWASDDEGASFHCLFRHLPQIFSVTAGQTA